MRESRTYRDSRARECFVRKKWLVSGAVWSLTSPQILGRPTTYQGHCQALLVQAAGEAGGLWLHSRDFGPRCAQLDGMVMLMKGRRLHTPMGSRMVPAGSAYHEGQGGREGMEENSWCLSQHLPSGGSHEELPVWICVPMGTVQSHSRAVCAELSSGLG